MEYPEQPTTPTISQHHSVLDPSQQATIGSLIISLSRALGDCLICLGIEPTLPTNVPNIPAQYPT